MSCIHGIYQRVRAGAVLLGGIVLNSVQSAVVTCFFLGICNPWMLRAGLLAKGHNVEAWLLVDISCC